MKFFSLSFLPFFHFHSVLLLISLFLYFLPAFLGRHRSDFTGLFLLNLFAGWTFIGWIIALIWALSARPQPQVSAQPSAAYPPQLAASASFFCTACGKPCAAGARYCSFCGAAQPATPR
jgi:Superinfection immunity protein